MGSVFHMRKGHLTVLMVLLGFSLFVVLVMTGERDPVAEIHRAEAVKAPLPLTLARAKSGTRKSMASLMAAAPLKNSMSGPSLSTPGAKYRATIHLNCENSELLEQAYKDAKEDGTFSRFAFPVFFYAYCLDQPFSIS